jgi:antitoxin component of RelBE/YafQ-DinJ toxin-antitoxin module
MSRYFVEIGDLTTYIPMYILWYMSTTTDKAIINIKVSKALKREAQDLADEIGLPLTTVISASLKEFVRSRSLTVSAFPRLRPEIEQELSEAIIDYKKSKNISKIFVKPSEVADHLNSL